MKARLVRIGNSRGVRLPKAVIEQAALDDEVELKVENQRVIISASRSPRAGWAEAARELGADSRGLLDASTPTRLMRPSGVGESAIREAGRRSSGRRQSHARSRDQEDAPVRCGLSVSSCLSLPWHPGIRRARSDRTVDRERLVRRLGSLSEPEFTAVLRVLREMFEP